MNFYDDQPTTVGELFERFFPGREDVIRLLMEPITYANGSTLEDPAITYGIVFSNFMSKGVFTFEGGTDRLIELMHDELRAERRRCADQLRRREDRLSSSGRVRGVDVNGRDDPARGAVVSNANLKQTIFRPRRRGAFRQAVRRRRPRRAAEQLQHAGLHGAQAGRADRRERRAICCSASTAPLFRTELLLSRDITSRTYSFYYPRTRPAGPAACLIVSSTNANYEDWAELCRRRLRGEQAGPDRNDARRTSTSTCPNIRERLDHVEAVDAADVSSTTRSTSQGRASARSSKAWPSAGPCPSRSAGCTTPAASASSCRGWLGAMNYGVIVANDVDSCLSASNAESRALPHRPTDRPTDLRTAIAHDARKQIKAAIPHREPFLLLDEIVEQTDARIVCRKTFTGDEFWYRGHYPDFPITPGVLLCEAAMQAGAVLLSKHGGRRARRRAGGDAGERRAVQADGAARRYDRDRSRAGRARVDGVFHEGARDHWRQSGVPV